MPDPVEFAKQAQAQRDAAIQQLKDKRLKRLARIKKREVVRLQAAAAMMAAGKIRQDVMMAAAARSKAVFDRKVNQLDID